MDSILMDFVDAGLPVLPTKDKKPKISSHKFLDDNLPTQDMYKDISDCDYAIKCGNTQTRIECIDFDLKNTPNPEAFFKKYCDLVDLTGLYCEKTPSGGYHIAYMTEEVPGSQKLAIANGYKEAWIETRGRGGYFVCAPSKGYKVLSGDIKNLPVISGDRVDEIKTAARSLNEQLERTVEKQTITPAIKVYNRIHSSEVFDYLMSDGWTVCIDKIDRWYLTRPGKTKGIGATLFKDTGWFYVFTSATKYNPSTKYSPVDIIGERLNKTPTEMREAVELELDGEHIKDLLLEIISNEGKLKPIMMLECLRGKLIEHMLKKGKFYRDNNWTYYFRDNELILIDGHSSTFLSYIYGFYGLNKSHSAMKFAIDGIELHGKNNGEDITVRNYTHYDNGCVYIDNFNGKMFKISCKDIEIVDNGTDGILFLKSHDTPIVYEPNQDKNIDILFKGINFEQGELSDVENKVFLSMWILSIYMIQNGRPICAMIGEKGSGKTFFFKKLLMCMFGNTDKVIMLPEKFSDFAVTVTSSKVLVIDNADGHRDWLNDTLATCSTGGTINVRKLYTTNDAAVYKVDCFIGVTSRTPKFTRDDVADRLLIFTLDRFKEFIPDNHLVTEIMNNRDRIMSSIFDTIQFCLSKASEKVESTVSRMSDFEEFCRRTRPETETIFKKLVEKQKEFSEDAFTDLFYEYCERSPTNLMIKTAKELSKDLNDLAQKINIKNIRLSSSIVGYKMKGDFEFCRIEKISLRARKTEYRITISCERSCEF